MVEIVKICTKVHLRFTSGQNIIFYFVGNSPLNGIIIVT